MLPVLGRRALSELVGTGGLVCAVIGSGIAAERLSPGDVGLQLLENSIATAMALVALILSLGSVSGAHMNPVVTGVEWARRQMSGKEAAVYMGAQLVGGIAGAFVANAMFELPAIQTASHVRSGAHLWLGEVVATIGLLVTIHGTAATNARAIPLAVGCYIGAAYWFTSSTSFANPAVTVARIFSDTFAGIAPSSAPGFVIAQVLGALVGSAVLVALLPGWRCPAKAEAGKAS